MKVWLSRPLTWFLAGYSLLLVILAPLLSLWLDEVLTLIGAYQPDMASLLDYIITFAGGTPLTFLPPRWSSQLLGHTAFAARLPSLLASLAACVAVHRLAVRMRVRSPILAVVLFAALPIQLRYALEVRPYALALALTVWSTELFLASLERPSERRLSYFYVGLLVASALAQPYAAFVAAAHFAWSLFRGRRATYAPTAALALIALLLLPWYAHFRQTWANAVGVSYIGPWQWRTSLVFLREISGSGYFGFALLLVGVVAGLRRAEPRAFWFLLLTLPILGIVVGNAVFFYFFAIRQAVYILPTLALLFAAGAQAIGKYGRVLYFALLAASCYADGKWLLAPREDWRAAADALRAEVDRGACVEIFDDPRILLLFQPGLADHVCLDTADHVAVALSAYTPELDSRLGLDRLAERGLRRQSTQSFNGPRVEVFSK